MATFRGSYEHTIDHKGRVSIPARFRRQLSGDANETFVVLRGLDVCVSLYPADEFKRLEERLRARSFTDETARRFLADRLRARMDPGRRRALHRSAAEILEAAGDEGEDAALLARLWREAGERENASSWATRAASRAEEAGDPVQGASMWAEALRLAGRDRARR